MLTYFPRISIIPGILLELVKAPHCLITVCAIAIRLFDVVGLPPGKTIGETKARYKLHSRRVRERGSLGKDHLIDHVGAVCRHDERRRGGSRASGRDGIRIGARISTAEFRCDLNPDFWITPLQAQFGTNAPSIRIRYRCCIAACSSDGDVVALWHTWVLACVDSCRLEIRKDRFAPYDVGNLCSPVKVFQICLPVTVKTIIIASVLHSPIVTFWLVRIIRVDLGQAHILQLESRITTNPRHAQLLCHVPYGIIDPHNDCTLNLRSYRFGSI